jgi:hypothetical protein
MTKIFLSVQPLNYPSTKFSDLTLALLLVQKTSIRLETQVAKRTMGARIEKNNRVQKKKWQ